MRFLSVLLAVSCCALASANWEVGSDHLLRWDSEPYAPIGARVFGSDDQIDAALQAGVRDLIVEAPVNPAAWPGMVSKLEAAHARYFISISSLCPPGKGYIVDPQGYRIANINHHYHLQTTILGSERALLVLVAPDKSVSQIQTVEAKDGLIVADIEPYSSNDYTLLMYPLAPIIDTPDLWEAFDIHRDSLLMALKGIGQPAGLRGIINPLGAQINVRYNGPRVVPTSPAARSEFRAFLEARYHQAETVERAWGLQQISGDWNRVVRLVPLWWKDRGIPYMWDPENPDKLIGCDAKHSVVWNDRNGLASDTVERRTEHLMFSLRKLIDVPILEDWNGFGVGARSRSELYDGIGAQSSGLSSEESLELAAQACSEVARGAKNAFALASQLDMPLNATAADLNEEVNSMSAFGIRGAFFRTSNPAQLKVIAAANGSNSAPSGFPATLFYPEAARNPARTQLLPGPIAWLPCPYAGNRMDFGSRIHAYRLEDMNGNGQLVLWCDGEPIRTRFQVVNAPKIKVQQVGIADPKPNFSANYFDLTISQLPVVVTGFSDLPIPKIAFDETTQRYGTIITAATTRHLSVDDDNFTIQDSMASYKDTPSASYQRLRESYLKLQRRLGSATWIEGENATKTNFGAVEIAPGTSGGRALSVDSTLNLADLVYYAEYTVNSRSADDQEVWIAAQIPVSLRGKVKLRLGSQVLTLPDRSVSPYGMGFAWYRLGVTRLPLGESTIRLEVEGSSGASMMVDSIVLSPGVFKPNGTFGPELTPSDVIKGG
ncbi:MAG: hypothetical protein JSS72_10945 [Armatimonadetes bacterium]|nr:hypothetical protein [Armatimonadota bacterium]